MVKDYFKIELMAFGFEKNETFVHQLVQNRLKLEGVVEVFLRKRRRQKQVWRKVKCITIESVTTSHADTCKTSHRIKRRRSNILLEELLGQRTRFRATLNAPSDE